MAFVNEYASDEDIEKYGLEAIWRRFNPNRMGPMFQNGPPAWTIDRERDAFLMIVGRGTREAGNLLLGVLCVKGQLARYHLFVNAETSDFLSANPYYKVWDRGKLDRYDGFDLPVEDADNLLKEALSVYGYSGARKQLPNTIVKFNF